MSTNVLDVTANVDEIASASPVLCAHCAQAVPLGYTDATASHPFCCAGCRTAYAILHAHGLERYYDLSDRETTPVFHSSLTELFASSSTCDVRARKLNGVLPTPHFPQ